MTCIFTNDGRGFHATWRTYARGPFKMLGKAGVDLHFGDTTVGRHSSCPANIRFGSSPRAGLAASICLTSLLCCLAMENRHSPLRTVCRVFSLSFHWGPTLSIVRRTLFPLLLLLSSTFRPIVFARSTVGASSTRVRRRSTWFDLVRSSP